MILNAFGSRSRGGLDVRPAAQVGEGVLLVDGDGRRGPAAALPYSSCPFASPSMSSSLYGLSLKISRPSSAETSRTLNGVLALDDLPHPVGDPFEVAVGRVHVEVEVVVEAVFDGRADGGLGLRELLDHRLRQDVGEGVAELVEVRGRSPWGCTSRPRPSARLRSPCVTVLREDASVARESYRLNLPRVTSHVTGERTPRQAGGFGERLNSIRLRRPASTRDRRLSSSASHRRP